MTASNKQEYVGEFTTGLSGDEKQQMDIRFGFRFEGRYVKIEVVTWNQYVSVRAGVLVATEPSPPPPSPPSLPISPPLAPGEVAASPVPAAVEDAANSRAAVDRSDTKTFGRLTTKSNTYLADTSSARAVVLGTAKFTGDAINADAKARGGVHVHVHVHSHTNHILVVYWYTNMSFFLSFLPTTVKPTCRPD